MSGYDLLAEAEGANIFEGCDERTLDNNGVSPMAIEMSLVRSDVRRYCEKRASGVFENKGHLRYPLTGTLCGSFMIVFK